MSTGEAGFDDLTTGRRTVSSDAPPDAPRSARSTCTVRPAGDEGWWVEIDGERQSSVPVPELELALEIAVGLCWERRIDGVDVHRADGGLHSRLPVAAGVTVAADAAD